MALWEVERREDGIVVAAYTNAPMNYFVAAGVEELAALVPTWRDPFGTTTRCRATAPFCGWRSRRCTN